jgi:hypothetical protein
MNKETATLYEKIYAVFVNLIIYKTSVHTSQRTQSYSIAKTYQFVVLLVTIGVSCGLHGTHTNTHT